MDLISLLHSYDILSILQFMGNGYIVCNWENVTERLDKVIVEINVDDKDDHWKPVHPCCDGIGFGENPLLWQTFCDSIDSVK